MNRDSLQQRVVSSKPASRFRITFACFGLLSIISSSALAQFKCDQPQLTRVDATACALGAKDAASLRRFITRTQAIYGLQMKDYVRFDDEQKAPPAPTAKATREAVAGVAPPARLIVE